MAEPGKKERDASVNLNASNQLPLKNYPEERRLASVLFADVQGFTALAERLDYEVVGDLLREIWNRLDAVIELHGGYIDKHIGDAVMAVWGAPFAGENDAERAVLAALDLQSALKDYVSSSTYPDAKELKLRVGINTGQVLAGYVGVHNEYTVIGDTVNVANRLEHAAEASAVLISESTYRVVRGMFKIHRLAPLQLKGKTEPVPAFVVEGKLTMPGQMRYRSVGSLQTHMVGRDEELARLDTLFRKAMDEAEPELATIVGEAGLGKSRLLMEFTSHLEVDEPTFLLLSARGLDQTSHVPFYMWKTLLHGLFGLTDEDPPETAREKFMYGLQRLWGKQLGPVTSFEAAHFLGNLTGLDWPDSPYLSRLESDPGQRIKRSFEIMREFLYRVCLVHKTALLFDDLHYADTGSLDLLAYLMEPGPQPLPLLILTGARPEMLRSQPKWANLGTVLPLHPLKADASTVAQAYPDLHDLPVDLLTSLAQRSDGNPYFLEEMVKGLLKAGLADEDLSIDDILARVSTQPPESLRAMLQARLDGLSREARHVALLASVVGRVFWVGAVRAGARPGSIGTGPLVSMPSAVVDRVIQDSLRQLVRAELAFPRAGSSFSDDQQYIFKHSLLREVAYSLIPHRYRMQYHLAVAQWMCDRPNPDFKLMAAEHFEQAGVLFEASRQYEQAARFARGRGLTKEADEMMGRAQSLRDKFKETA